MTAVTGDAMSSNAMATTAAEVVSTEKRDVSKFIQTVAKFALKPERLENVAWPEWDIWFCELDDDNG